MKKILYLIITMLFAINGLVPVTAQSSGRPIESFSFEIDENQIKGFGKNQEIIIPYKISDTTEFPANEYYKKWNKEFLTPRSYAKSSMPDTLQIDFNSFEFPIIGKVNSPFGLRNKRMHYGIDLKLKTGDTIRSAFDGRVRLERYEARGYGKYMVIRHSNGLETIYAHLSKFLVEPDQFVRAGEAVALGGNTGRSSGPHLHFETRFMGVPINPSELVDFSNSSLLAETIIYTPKNRKIVRVKKTPIIAQNDY